MKKFIEPDKDSSEKIVELKSINFLFHDAQASFQKVIVFNLNLKGKHVEFLACRFSVDFRFSADIAAASVLWPFGSSIFGDVFSASPTGPIRIALLVCKYRRILSATRHRPRPSWTRHIGHRAVFGRHFSHTICPLTHWNVCDGDAGIWGGREMINWSRDFNQKIDSKLCFHGWARWRSSAKAFVWKKIFRHRKLIRKQNWSEKWFRESRKLWNPWLLRESFLKAFR